MSATYRRQIERLFAHSAFDREKLRAAGFDSPAAVGGIENIAALPFTEKDELRKSQAEHPPLGAHAAIDISQAARIYSTSGTSGTPLYIPLTKSDVEDWRRIGRDTYSKNGLKAGERVVTTFGAGPFVAGASLAAFGARVYEIMGIGDIAASLWGECEAQAGMHFSGEGIVHVELIDPDTGRTVELKDGATGELVYTHLRREAAPLLRFRSRDHVRVWVSACACGRTSHRVRCIGRTDDMLIVRGVNVFPTAVREVVARFQPRVTGAIQIRPRRRGVKQDPPLPVLVDGHPALGQSIAKEIRNTLLFTAEVRLVEPQSLPRSDYKSKLVDYSEAS